VNIRPEREGDAAAVRTILVAAFGRQAEADLVERLRRDDDFMLSLVADDGGICGYIGFPRLLVEGSRGVREAAGLAPVAVTSPLQRRGIGSALIREGQRRLTEEGVPIVFVLGDPAYYTRFGYSVSAARPFKSTYSGLHFMALLLSADVPDAGMLRYPAAFEQLP
jgi:putative acetyltransferase